jgi:transposase
MKASLVRLGLRDLNPAQRKAAGRVDDLRTPEDGALPPLAKAELRRANPREERDGMVRLLTRVVGVGVESSRPLCRLDWLAGRSGSKRRERGLSTASRDARP